MFVDYTKLFFSIDACTTAYTMDCAEMHDATRDVIQQRYAALGWGSTGQRFGFVAPIVWVLSHLLYDNGRATRRDRSGTLYAP